MLLKFYYLLDKAHLDLFLSQYCRPSFQTQKAHSLRNIKSNGKTWALKA